MQEARRDGERRPRVGIATSDPLRSLGLETILNEKGAAETILCDLHEALADTDLAALLLDDHLDGEDVIATVTRLRQERPDLKLIVLGEAPDFAYIEEVVGAGARGYLLETTTEAEIRTALEVVLNGSVWAPRKVLARLIDAKAPEASKPTLVAVAALMTARERQVLALLIDGGSNREIGNALGIDEVTVKAHLGRMLRKTRSKNRVELTLRAIAEQTAAKRMMPGAEKHALRTASG